MTFAGSLGGRLSWSLRCANAPAEATPSIAITTNCRSSLIISDFLLMQVPAHGREKEMRRPIWQQERCHKTEQHEFGAFCAKSLTVHAEIRTVSNRAAPYRITQKATRRSKLPTIH